MFPLHDTICQVTYGDDILLFAIDDKLDEIQRYLFSGSFYEIEQLEFHRSLIPNRGNVLDIGANIGNHTIFYASVCRANSVIAVEPNPRSFGLLQRSVVCNGLAKGVSIERVAFGPMGATWGTIDDAEARAHNLGGARLLPALKTEQHAVLVVPGDIVVYDAPVDFVKIDVEGSEMDVLAGLAATIERTRPIIAIEVMPGNRELFSRWCDESRYRIERTFHMYRSIHNYILVPK